VDVKQNKFVLPHILFYSSINLYGYCIIICSQRDILKIGCLGMKKYAGPIKE